MVTDLPPARRQSIPLARLLCAALCLPLVGCHLVRGPTAWTGRVGETAVQALAGAGEYHKLEFRRRDPADPNNSVTADLSTMPLLGIAGQYAISAGNPEIGLDGGLLYAWDHDRGRVPSPGPGGVLELDRRLRTVEGFFGPYLSAIFADSLRVYGALGASLMHGDAEYDDGVILEQDSAFGVGAYLRGGVEYRLEDRSFLGLGVRWVATELDFGGQIGDLDVEGWQGFLTYTVGF